LPAGKIAIGTKWILKNKKDARGIVVRNKALLVAQGHSSVATALADPDWVAALQEEMQQFYHQQVWKLVPLPAGKIAISTKWILKNKKDARGIVVRNKARLVAQGHRKEEGIDYDEFWATATVRPLEAGPFDIIATIDGTEVMVIESLIRTQLQLDDVNGLYEFTLHDVLDGMRAIGFIMDGMLGNEPTPDSPNPPSPPPNSVAVGPTTSSRQPSPSRHPSVPEDIREGGGDFVSSPQSNDALQTPAATAAGGAEDSTALTALSFKLDRCLHRVTTLENELGITKKVLGGTVLKLVTRVKRLERLLQQRKRRLVLSDSEGENATTTEQEFDLAALHTLASVTLGDDSFATAAGPDAETTMPVHSTSTTRMRLRKHSVDTAVHAAAAPSSSIPTAADKGKAPTVDDSLPADLLSEQERVLKNLHDSQLGEELAKKIHAEQEVEFARQQEELA
nr:copia protein [Tanacetum cinerariifolium]